MGKKKEKKNSGGGGGTGENPYYFQEKNLNADGFLPEPESIPVQNYHPSADSICSCGRLAFRFWSVRIDHRPQNVPLSWCIGASPAAQTQEMWFGYRTDPHRGERSGHRTPTRSSDPKYLFFHILTTNTFHLCTHPHSELFNENVIFDPKEFWWKMFNLP